MKYYFNKVLKGKSFEETIELVTAELKKEGFGIVTEIDMKETLKKKIDVDFKKYKILRRKTEENSWQPLHQPQYI